MSVEEVVKRSIGVHDKIARSHPSLERGRVWCHRCGHTQRVDSAQCLRSGWPLCCGETMSIDSPEERARLREGAPQCL